MENSIVMQLTELGYDGADIHWLHSFYEIGLIIENPKRLFPTEKFKQRLRYSKLEKLVISKDKFYIDQAIEFGKVGLVYGDVQFKAK